MAPLQVAEEELREIASLPQLLAAFDKSKIGPTSESNTYGSRSIDAALTVIFPDATMVTGPVV